VGTGVGTLRHSYVAKMPYAHPSIVMLFHLPSPRTLFKSATPLSHTDVLTLTWSGQIRGLPVVHQSKLLSLP
jgi:hypothetical protein